MTPDEFAALYAKYPAPWTLAMSKRLYKSKSAYETWVARDVKGDYVLEYRDEVMARFIVELRNRAP